ncbi:hypothetical protein FS837_010657 [Tulasnella sp. UAMH 9824]|nr:hypothetical protein FS837_010657 [Tulasnella sp. UAMH 9824]
MMPYDPSRVGAPAPSPQPNVAPVPAASTARTPAAPTLLPFGAVSGSAAKPTFGFGSSVPSFGSTAFGSTTPTVTPNKPAFGQPAFGATTTPTFGTPNFGATTTPTAFGKPVFGQTSFRAAPAAPAFAGFGAASQKSALGRSGFGSGSGISTTSVQTPRIAGATGTRNHASRLAVSRAPGLESPSSTSPSTPQPNFGSTGFGAFNPVSTTPTTTPNPFVVVAAAQPKKSLAILPSSGAFGQTSGTTSAFGSFGNAAKPAAFSLDKPDGPSASTATPTFGATTSLGTAGFGAHSAPEQSSSVQPVKVGTGGGFAGFGGSGGFGGFGSVAAKAGTQNIFGGTTPTPPAIKIEPSTSPKTAFLFGNGSKAFAPQSGFGASRGQQDTANEEEDQERKERFPESENDNKEPTQTNLDFFAPPQSLSGSEGASSSKFSLMSLGTARPESQATTPGIQTVFVPATPSKSPQSAIPMSTTTTLFPGPPNPSGPSPVRTPMQEERPISPANNQEEVGEEAKKEDTTEPSASPKTAFLFGNGTPKLPARESLFTGEANKEWRHPKFFLSDFVDIQVESMLYRVPGALMQQSEIFKSSLPTSESSSSLYVNEITTQEMETFLDVADARLVIGDDQFTFEQWAGALATANRLGTRRIRDYIVQRLEGHLNRLDPFDCIDVATKYRVHEWLFQPFIRICERQEPLSPAEVLRLGSERTSAVCRVREQLLAHKYDSAITWVGNQWPKDRNFSPPPPLEPPQWEAMATTLEAARVDEVKRLVELETVLSKPDFQSPGSPPTVDIVPQGVAHPKYWQTDLRTIRVRNCLYRLPIRYFEQPGLLRNIRNNEDSPLESGDFVILPHDVIVSDWNIFLDILTARPFDEPPLSLGFSSWMTGLRLSIRFRQESVQRYVLQRIQTDFPEQDPIDLLEAAKMGDADHSNWLQSLYNSLSQRKGSLSPEEIHRIGEKATAEVCRLRDQYMWDAGRRGALNVF